MLPKVWPVIETLHANTLEIPVAWEQIEPREGKFDFSYVDILLKQARQHHVRLVQGRRLDVGDPQAPYRHAQFLQGVVLGDGKVLAVPAAAGNHFRRGRPIVFHFPMRLVADKGQAVEKGVDRAEQLPIVAGALCLLGLDGADESLPGADA